MVSGVTLLRLTSRSVGIPIQDQELMPQGRILEEQMAPWLQDGGSEAKQENQPAKHASEDPRSPPEAEQFRPDGIIAIN